MARYSAPEADPQPESRMCRLLAYLGPPVSLRALVSEPEHSLVVQSYAPREMSSGVVNADGFGYAWYDRERRETPYRYRSVLPIWNDVNRESVEDYAVSGCVVANVRSATPGQSLDISNTQPFVHGRMALLHNGYVEDYRARVHGPLRRSLTDEVLDRVHGTTDSEYLAAWLIAHVEAGGDMADSLADGIAGLRALVGDARMTLNFIVGDGERLAATRTAHNMAAPSLYILAGHDRFPEAVLVASEPLFDHASWTPVPEGNVVTVDPDRTVRTRAL